MFEKGNYIFYGSTGVCKVEDITTLKLKDVPKDRLYYILHPYFEATGKIYAPVDNKKIVMRSIMTNKEAKELIDSIPETQELWIENDKLREEKYKTCIKTCECSDLIKIIKTLYLRKQERMAQGKKVTAVDDKYLRIAEDNLYSEMSIALEIPRDEMRQYITDRMEMIGVIEES